MAKTAKDINKPSERTGSLGFEAKLWEAADLLRNNIDPVEYQHVVLGLVFPKCIEDAFEEQHAKLPTEQSKSTDPRNCLIKAHLLDCVVT